MATQASALSCKPPSFGDEFNRIAAAPELYHIAIGTLEVDGAIPPFEEGQPRAVEFRFSGEQLTGGQRWGEGQAITTRTRCTREFCGALPPTQTPLLVFVRDDPDGLSLISALCRPDFMVNPSLGQRTAIRACLRAGKCGPEEIKALDLSQPR